ncbi:MAG: formyltransferase family protein [Rhodospirillaceae bacterium]
MSRLILMTQREFEEPLTDALRRAAPGVSLSFAWTLADLDAELANDPDGSRILSIGSSVILPRRVLARLRSPAYNLHPGPPNYPGIFPSVFALYEGARAFGVTLHEMAPTVDSGAICAVEHFPIDARWDRLALDTHTLVVLMHVLERMAPQLANVHTPLGYSGDVWSGRCRTRKHFDALCHLPEDFTAVELAQRLRAVGEGPDHCLTTTRDGQVLRLDTGRRGMVVRAGQPVAAE